jgi:hypothetical protein
MEAVVQGRRFIGARHGGRLPEPAVAPRPPRHDVVFSGDGSIVDHYASFAAAALAAGSALVVLATDEHRGDLERRLHAGGVDVARGARDGWYLGSGTEAVLSAIVLDGWPDEDRFWSVATSLMLTAASASHARQPRVALCGEGASQLLAQGRVDAAIRLEQLCGELTRTYNIDLLCGYAAALSGCDHRVSGLEGICAAHSAVLAS